MALVARVVSYPLGLYASANSGINSVQDLFGSRLAAKVKKDPQLASIGSSGAGSITEFLGVLMSREFGMKMTVVPFKCASEVKTMLMSGHVSVSIMSPSDVIEDVKHVRPLGLIAAKRWSLARHIPRHQCDPWQRLHGLVGLQQDTREMEEAVRNVMEKPVFRQKLAKAYLEADYGTAQQLDKQVRDLITYWRPVGQASGFKPT